MKYILLFTFLLIAMIASGQSDTVESLIKYDSKKQKEEIDCGLMFIVEQMPMFPACDSLTKYEERKACADKAMLDFIYPVKYPTICREGCVEGTAVVSFIVEKDGTLTNHKIIRDPGCGIGDEALRIVKLFPNFEPGKNDGQPVRVQFNLPIRFRLE